MFTTPSPLPDTTQTNDDREAKKKLIEVYRNPDTCKKKSKIVFLENTRATCLMYGKSSKRLHIFSANIIISLLD